jgi:hypothetical protein
LPRSLSSEFSNSVFAAPADPETHLFYTETGSTMAFRSPLVLINVMGGGDQVASLKQFVQFFLDKQMAVGQLACR